MTHSCEVLEICKYWVRPIQPGPLAFPHLRGIQVHTSDAECACRQQVIPAEKPLMLEKQ